MRTPQLPIQAILPDIVQALISHTRLVLKAPPGAGKTTQLPLALLGQPWLGDQRIVMLEPRRVAARAAATYMAAQLGEEAGGTVGYRIRFESRLCARTRIEVVTEGLFTRMLQDDPALDGIGAVLFDEFHERHLPADLGLALALDAQAGLRDDLRIVVMSATLEGARLAERLDAPCISSEGRAFPVTVSHLPAAREESLEVEVSRAVKHAVDAHEGDILVFLPGEREIRRAHRLLEAMLPSRIEVLTLHGELPIEAQTRVLQPAATGERRVVLATNVAESSVTLPGVRVVIDSGLARELRFDPNSGFSKLALGTISQASADQRAGRAGRVAEGWAYRLWPESKRLEPQRTPEIAQADLTGLALELAAWGGMPPFIETPPPGTLAAARDLLCGLGALDAKCTITALGRRMLALGTHPRLAAMLVNAAPGAPRALACDLAALLEARDPQRDRSDTLATRWQSLAAFRRGRAPADAHRSTLAAIDTAARQWRRRLREDGIPPVSAPAHALGDLLIHAYPDRIARLHPTQRLRYTLSNGRSAVLRDDSTLMGEPWLVVGALQQAGHDARIDLAAPVDEDALRQAFPHLWCEGDEVRWDAGRRALVNERISRFGRIVLGTKPAGRPDMAQAATALTEAVRALGLGVLPWNEPLRQWRCRVQCLRAWMPELDLPDMGDDALLASLETWLKPAFAHLTRLDALGEPAFADALKSHLAWPSRRALDAHAPTHLAVPSGLERALSYTLDGDGAPAPPVLAVKLQELFGLAETPRIAAGRVPVMLHLLSPGGRPLQVTQDLPGFWDRTYAEIAKEMKGRYPRHPWPQDPWNGPATHRAKPRGT